MTLSSDPNDADIIDIQDKLGYVDTGPIQQRQAKTTRNQPSYTPVTSSTSHIILKEPIPQRQVHFPMDYNNNAKKRSSTSARPEMGQNAFHGATQPTQNTVKKSNSLDTTTNTALDTNNNVDSIPYSLNVSHQTLQQQQQQQRPPVASRSNSFNNSNKGKERQHVTINETPSLAIPTSSASSSSTDPSLLKYSTNSGNIGLRGPPQTTQATEEIKDLIVSKFLELKELADILQLINEPLPQPMYNHKRSFEQQPRPTPSKSDPNYPQLRRKPSQGRMAAGYAYPSSPENNRQMYNKSADSTTNYQEPNNRHTTSSRGIYNNNNTRDYQMDHHDNRTPHDGNGYYGHPPPQAASYYHNLYDGNRDAYYLANEEPYRVDPEEYYMSHPHPPPPVHQVHAQRMQPPSRFYDGRQRRKSFSNLHEEQYRLNRKGSRGNMRRSMARQQQAPAFYEYADMAPPPPHLHHHHHHPAYAYGGGGGGGAPYYSNQQQYSPNGGGGGGKGNGDYYS
ncbi:hypothetical protein V8B55DRAFT_1455764 [Mucor lusitanicus]|uniref:Uncharacterized protein n=2 Tax=Mucor circinelloides f. lusitanicus TaxID=29924 RepID=A0A168K3P2_MUCCL|nr:hypothetical protein FB192DRAFT_1349926 [Mucor lusitanicus]OAD01961.1 hypothetical protein MUCCIDRAFT_82341 [Mucor lusitanicus CBS 277.49]